MQEISNEISNLKCLMKMLAEQFGKKSEFILHDLKKGEGHTVVTTENSREIKNGEEDGGTMLGADPLKSSPFIDGDTQTYLTETKDGRIFRSSAMYIRNDQGEPIGSLCINTDLTLHLQYRKELEPLTVIHNEQKIEEQFGKNVGELIDFFIDKSTQIVDKNGREMTMEERISVVRYLDSKGFFLITHSGDKACAYLGISKYTLYKYLGQIREEGSSAKK